MYESLQIYLNRVQKVQNGTVEQGHSELGRIPSPIKKPPQSGQKSSKNILINRREGPNDILLGILKGPK